MCCPSLHLLLFSLQPKCKGQALLRPGVIVSGDQRGGVPMLFSCVARRPSFRLFLLSLQPACERQALLRRGFIVGGSGVILFLSLKSSSEGGAVVVLAVEIAAVARRPRRAGLATRRPRQAGLVTPLEQLASEGARHWRRRAAALTGGATRNRRVGRWANLAG